MKNFFIFIIVLCTIGFLFINFSTYTKKVTQVDKIKELHKEHWKDALMEFADDDDTLDSLDYVPEWLIL